MDVKVLTEEECLLAPRATITERRGALGARAIAAGVSARDAEDIIAAAEGALLVALDGVATIRSLDCRGACLTSDPTQAVFVRPGHRVTIDPGTSSGRAFSVIAVSDAGFLDVDDLLPADDGIECLAAVPWNPRRMVRLAWLHNRVNEGVGPASLADVRSAARVHRLPPPARDEATALLAEACSAGRRRRASLRRLRGRAAPTHKVLTESAKRLVATEPAQSHSLAAVAHALYTSPYHLAHVFRMHAGVSFHRFLLDLRIAISLRQLSAEEMHLSTLALHLGFATHSHFTAAFRRAVGFPPSKMRRMLESSKAPLAVRDAHAMSAQPVGLTRILEARATLVSSALMSE
jgi:AraC-like DNA-binding protein